MVSDVFPPLITMLYLNLVRETQVLKFAKLNAKIEEIQDFTCFYYTLKTKYQALFSLKSHSHTQHLTSF